METVYLKEGIVTEAQIRLIIGLLESIFVLLIALMLDPGLFRLALVGLAVINYLGARFRE